MEIGPQTTRMPVLLEDDNSSSDEGAQAMSNSPKRICLDDLSKALPQTEPPITNIKRGLEKLDISDRKRPKIFSPITPGKSSGAISKRLRQSGNESSSDDYRTVTKNMPPLEVKDRMPTD